MNKLTRFIQKERLYILILILVLLFNAVLAMHNGPKQKAQNLRRSAAAAMEAEKTRRSEFEEKLRKDEKLMVLFSLASLLILAVVLLGMVIDLLLFLPAITGKLNIRTLDPPREVQWNLWDVCKVVILFMFFGYMILLTEVFLARVFRVLRADNFRMVLNTSILDILTVVFIVYFTVIQYKVGLKNLGISFRNFFKNVFYGITGYVALAPALILILAATAAVIGVTKYVPQRQPVVELFLKEKGTAFLTYSSLFAAVAGPIIEELFFRAFMYTAFKKYVGIFWAMILSAALFSALHAHVVGFVPIMILGIFLAYLYEKTGTLISSITVHVAHNLSMVFLVFLIKHSGAF